MGWNCIFVRKIHQLKLTCISYTILVGRLMLLLLFLNAVFFLKGKNFAPLTKTRAYCAFYGIGVFISSKSYSLYKFVRYVSYVPRKR